MTDVVLALDQGTTSSKALLVEPSELRVIATAARPVRIRSPRSGWMEQDAEELWSSTCEAAAEAITKTPDANVVAIAISNQRESVIAWDGTTGNPLAPVISWQDQRGVTLCDELAAHAAFVAERTGLELTAMYSATKLRWLIGSVKKSASLRLGTIDTWLLDRLTGGEVYSTEIGNAARTLLFDITRLDWDPELCALFGVLLKLLPSVRQSSGLWGVTRNMPGIPDGTPILAVLGDSHAALYGHWVLSPGQGMAGKATYGTGSSVMMPAGGSTARRRGVSTTLAWQFDTPLWAYEANILFSGAGLDWLGNNLGVNGGRGITELAASAGDSGGAVFVPALNGIGAPWWEPSAVGTLTGMSVNTGRPQLARAGLESVANQICDIVDVMDPDGNQELLHAGGGATSSALLMQIQANLLGRNLLVSKIADISAIGVAALAARGLGITPQPRDSATRLFAPETDFTSERRSYERSRWRDALARAGIADPALKNHYERIN